MNVAIEVMFKESVAMLWPSHGASLQNRIQFFQNWDLEDWCWVLQEVERINRSTKIDLDLYNQPWESLLTCAQGWLIQDTVLWVIHNIASISRALNAREVEKFTANAKDAWLWLADKKGGE